MTGKRTSSVNTLTGSSCSFRGVGLGCGCCGFCCAWMDVATDNSKVKKTSFRYGRNKMFDLPLGNEEFESLDAREAGFELPEVSAGQLVRSSTADLVRTSLSDRLDKSELSVPLTCTHYEVSPLLSAPGTAPQ